MTLFFYISLLGFIFTIPLYYLSLDHLKREKKYGKEKGKGYVGHGKNPKNEPRYLFLTTLDLIELKKEGLLFDGYAGYSYSTSA